MIVKPAKNHIMYNQAAWAWAWGACHDLKSAQRVSSRWKWNGSAGRSLSRTSSSPCIPARRSHTSVLSVNLRLDVRSFVLLPL